MQIENPTNSEEAGRTKIIKSIINTPQVCRRWEPEGRGAAPDAPGRGLIFIYELALSRMPENPGRRSQAHSRAEESGSQLFPMMSILNPVPLICSS